MQTRTPRSPVQISSRSAGPWCSNILRSCFAAADMCALPAAYRYFRCARCRSRKRDIGAQTRGAATGARNKEGRCHGQSSIHSHPCKVACSSSSATDQNACGHCANAGSEIQHDGMLSFFQVADTWSYGSRFQIRGICEKLPRADSPAMQTLGHVLAPLCMRACTTVPVQAV